MKRLVFLLTVALGLLFTFPALAGPYLNSAAMLLREGFQSAEFLKANVGDRELARVAHDLAEARANAAGHMTVPKEVEKAHPHLLLTLAALERASDAATRGEVSNCLRNIETARGEARTFRSLLEQSHLALPNLRECSLPPSPGNSPQPARSALWRVRARLTVDPPRLATRTDLSR